MPLVRIPRMRNSIAQKLDIRELLNKKEDFLSQENRRVENSEENFYALTMSY